MPVWKKLLLCSAGFGAGLTLALVAALGTWSWYAHRPKPDPSWDASSIKADITGISISTHTADSFVATLQYKLSNTTDKDYSMPPESARIVMTKLPADNGYSRGSAVMDVEVFIPAHNNMNVNVRVSFDYSDLYPATQHNDRDKMIALLKMRLKELDGFVIFDRANHYKIELPNPGTFGHKISKNPVENPSIRDDPPGWTPVPESTDPAKQH